MPRHPGLQADNRVRELESLLRYSINEVRNTKYVVKDAEKKLEKAQGDYLEAVNKYNKIKGLLDRLADNDGIFPWGLPASISIKEFKELVPSADIQDKDLLLEEEYKAKELNARSVSD